MAPSSMCSATRPAWRPWATVSWLTPSAASWARSRTRTKPSPASTRASERALNAVRALVIGPEDLDELATGRGGERVLDTLRAGQITKHVLLVGEVAHAARARAPEAARVLAAADALDPAATRAVL